MDPTALLLRIRGLLKAADTMDEQTAPASLVSVLEALREDVRDLDEWLSKGGFAPRPWQPGEVMRTMRDTERHIREALAVGNSHSDEPSPVHPDILDVDIQGPDLLDG